MELDWSTFVLEIINFLVLVWLLTHFFYKPVINIIAKRRQEIKNELDDAESIRSEAETIKTQYENRLVEWQQERSDARLALHKEIDNERLKLLDELEKSMEQERIKNQIINQRNLQDELRKNEKIALSQSTIFTSRLLANLASPTLETGIIQLALDNLREYSVEEKQLLQAAFAGENTPINVTSVYELDNAICKNIEKTLSAILDSPLHCEFKQDPALIAGLQIEIGCWNLHASLQDELKYFSAIDHEHS